MSKPFKDDYYMLNLKAPAHDLNATETFSLRLDPVPSMESVQSLCKIFGNVLKISRIDGALTNSIYKVHLSDKIILLRIYGIDSDKFIDRFFELNCFMRMSELGLGPKCLATFSNGRIEEYLAAEPLTPKLMRSESLEIAQALVHLHNVPSDSPLILWDRLRTWYNLAVDAAKEIQRLNVSILHDLDLQAVENDMQNLRNYVGESKSLVFSHNDLQYGNIIRLEGSKEMIFLDYEYAGTNYMEFDFANHFCEWMADYHSSMPHVLNPDLYPNIEDQRSFINHYLKSQKLYGCSHIANAEEILSRIPYFTAISHLLWGFWGIFRGAALLNCSNDFDYLSYGIGRILMYLKTRKYLKI